MLNAQPRPPQSWFARAMHFVVIGGLILLGLIGLVLPIIPGLVFLCLALVLLAQVSTRVHALVGGHGWFRRLRHGWSRLTRLKSSDRLRLAFWYCAQAVVTAADAVVRFVDRQLRRS